MIRLQEKERVFKGEITAFLTLLFVLMLSLVAALVESASIQMTKNRKRADTILALESCFAEYHRDMLDEYDLFVRHGCEEQQFRNRMEYYGATNMNHSITRKELLSDNSGKNLYEQAVRYEKNWLGIEELANEETYEFFSETFLEEEELVHMDLQERLEEEQASLPEEGNPISTVQNLKNTNLITLISSNSEELSDRTIDIDTLPSGRTLHNGNWSEEISAGAGDKMFFVAYLLEHFSDYTEQDENQGLLYEQEYLLGGCSSDKENLEKVCEKILSIRLVVNYTYLLTDLAKQAEAEALALTICSLLTVPGITEVVKHALLFAWAYGESIVDLRALLKGKRVAAIKTTESWQLQLENLVKLGTEEDHVQEMDVANGVNYQGYVRGLLCMANKERLSMRCLDLIESNLRIKTDECITKAEIKTNVTLRRGVKDTFSTVFQYQ